MNNHYKDYFQSNTLQDNAFDSASDTVVTITKVNVQSLQTKDGKQDHLCAMLDGYEKPLRINKTIAKNIAKALKTPDVTQWVGKQITIYIEQGLRAFGELHDVPRVRPVAPTAQINVASYEMALNQCPNIDSLRATYSKFPKEVKANPFITGLSKRLAESFKEQNTGEAQ